MAARFQIDSKDPVPLYAQLERAIKLAAVSGALKVGDQLPTVRQMAVDLKINANTVAKVYADLEREGILATRRGVGTFVEAYPKAPPLSKRERGDELRRLVDRFLGECVAAGFPPDEAVEQILRVVKLSKEKKHG
jgi:GntR family transcriptional regulator